MSWIEIERLFSQYGPLRELELDDDLKQHLEERGITRKHIVSFAEILEVFAGTPRILENQPAPGRRAPLVMVGPTVAGRFLTVPIEPTGKWGIWRPMTAFESNTGDITRHRET